MDPSTLHAVSVVVPTPLDWGQHRDGDSPGYLTGFAFGRVNFVPAGERRLWAGGE